MRRTSFAAGLLAGIAGTLVTGFAAWLAVAYSGAYNVAATDDHADPVRWTLDTTMRRSVASRAGGADLPADVTQSQFAEGAGEYAEYCAHCHGAPGQNPAEWSRGMRPQPPLLVEAAADWSLAEIRWIVENGIRMTGMPAFGPRHEAEEITAIAAFVSRLPGLDAPDYAAMTGGEQTQADEAPSQ